MTVTTLAALKAQLSFTDDLGGADDALLEAKLAAAQNHVERLLGYKIEDQFGNEVPASLVEAILQLAAWWYENREAASDGAREVPFGVREIIAEYREWSF
ncbi:head-tail connector protein [Cereibacter sphaeroides]|uniref:head-tail connector protein n=1 Tax=Cereibacter sphaeroides TaxID=1063 RepID=UPI001F371C13|nr:head-tail connector protein [Cereibacter sphaeroides]MCE6960576.1 head-tail connector protein [Cereibacter sphaeroides]MCE6972743.1 head-tail connector protein [Cereibacter sphaeroides]